jgi:hypothetical protein
MKDAFSWPLSPTVFFERRFKDTNLFEKKHERIKLFMFKKHPHHLKLALF